MTRVVSCVRTEHVAAEEVLCIAGGAAAHAFGQHVRAVGEKFNDLYWHDLNLHGPGSSPLQCLHLAKETSRLLWRLAYSSEIGPSGPVRAYITHIDVLATEAIRLQLLEIARIYDALVIVVPARESIVDALRSVAARIPVVTLSTDLPLNAAHYYVGPDNYKTGRLAAELMGRMLGPAGGRVLLIAGLQAFLDVLRQDFRNCAVAAEIDCLDQGAMVADSVAAALLENPQIRGIYNISQGNDVITRCIRQQDIRKELIIICHDLTPTTIALLRAREIHAVIDQAPLLEAKRAIELILQHHGRLEAPSLSGSTPLHVYFRENAHGEIL